MRLPRLAAWRDAVNRKTSAWLTGLDVRQHCQTCRGPSDAGSHCAACLEALPLNRWSCIRCAEPLLTPLPGPVLCAHCLTRMPAFDRVYAPLLYAPPVDRATQALKFHGDLRAAQWLADWLDRHLPAIPTPNLVIPVPLHPTRIRARGYNQALEIARPLTRARGWTLAPDIAHRHRATRAQSELDAEARRRNLKGAFRICGAVDDARVLIVDDVVTTAATASSLAAALRAAGAAEVMVVAAARTPHADSRRRVSATPGIPAPGRR